MLGALIYRLKAETSDSLPAVHGHLMHGAFFHIVQSISPSLSRELHNSEFKPFTVSMLSLPSGLKNTNNRWEIIRGTSMQWRVTALKSDLLQVLLSVPIGYSFHIGNLVFYVEEIVADPDIEPRSGVIEEEDLSALCFQRNSIRSIQMEFLSTTSFRCGHRDFPWPSPGLVFGSLADKWSKIHFEEAISPQEVRGMAECISLENWHGRSQRMYFQRGRGINGFLGSFRFNLENISLEWKRYLLLLSSYGEFSGVGRLASQGLGQICVSCSG